MKAWVERYTIGNAKREFGFPSFEEGGCARPTQCHATLNRAQPGRSDDRVQICSDLPGRAEAKVTRHLLDRRGRPSSKEGKTDSRFAYRTRCRHTGAVET